MNNLRRLLTLPVVRTAYRYRFNREFEKRGMGTFRGVYSTFADAMSDAPPTKPVGYDNPGPASLYRERMHQLFPSDYSMVFWLDRLLSAGCRQICDVGGHVGIAFYSFRRYIDFPSDLSWTVVDVPAVCDAGRAVAKEFGVDKQLKFETSVSIADGKDLLFASGSLQYVESPLFQALGTMREPPASLLINNLPVSAGDGFVTLQNIGNAYCPYVIFNDRTLLGGFESLGYDLYDRWSDLTHYFMLPLNPERNFGPYSGFFLTSKRSPIKPPSPLSRLADDARMSGG